MGQSELLVYTKYAQWPKATGLIGIRATLRVALIPPLFTNEIGPTLRVGPISLVKRGNTSWIC